MANRLFFFVGGKQGTWKVQNQVAIRGSGLSAIERLEVTSKEVGVFENGFVLRGITSNERYVESGEHAVLVSKQESLGRREATFASLIPIRKSPKWWSLSQNERRDIFESQSRHIGIGVKYLPSIARRLLHCRDISDQEPFDFLTWFEFSPKHESAFNDLLGELRKSEEWTYVEREVEFRLERTDA